LSVLPETHAAPGNPVGGEYMPKNKTDSSTPEKTIKAIAKKEKDKKPNIFVRTSTNTSRWLREMRSELKKVVWPTRKQLLNNSLIVLVAILAGGFVISVFDYVCVTAIDGLIGLFR
jgi:preprotein translocase subunit SecE